MCAAWRSIVGTLLLFSALLIVAACAPAAQPGPTAVPTQPAPIAKPTASDAAAAKPAATLEPKPAPEAAWKVEWDNVVAAAKKEGKVAVAGRTGDAARRGVTGFEKAYPEIRLDWTGIEGGDFASKVIAEQKAGLYLWDLFVGGAGSLIRVTLPAGVHDPLKPALIIPEVLDNSKWRGGLDNWWQDAERQYVLGFEAGKQDTIWVNRDFVPQSELNTFDQLLDPKWKGKIISGDLTAAGASGSIGAWFVKYKGEDWFRKFVGQVDSMKDERSVVEAAIRGTHPVMVGLSVPAIATFYQQGLMKNFEALEVGNVAASYLTTGPSNVALLKNAPNPDAQKVFLNWFLSKEGQQGYADATSVESARLDVKGDAPALEQLKPGVEYVLYLSREMEQYQARSNAIAKEVLSK